MVSRGESLVEICNEKTQNIYIPQSVSNFETTSFAKQIQKEKDDSPCEVFDCKELCYPSDMCTHADKCGKTLLHHACTIKNKKVATETAQRIFQWCVDKDMEAQEQVDFVNKRDDEGNTALQHATKKRNKSLIKLLIENGADIILLKKDHSTKAIHLLYDKILINFFDNSIKLEKEDDDEEMNNESVWKVDCEFGPITGLHNPRLKFQSNGKKPLNQTSHLAGVLRRKTATREAVLQHPLVQIFLNIKGDKFKSILYASMIYHILWSIISVVFIFCNTHILDSTNIKDSVRKSNLTALCQSFRIYESGTYEFHYNVYFYIMVLLYIFSVAKEIVELYTCPDKWYYWKQLENLGQWVVNVTIFVVWIVSVVSRIKKTDNDLYEGSFLEEYRFLWIILLPLIYIAGIFASLLLIQGQLTKTEFLGIYNEMFANGFLNLTKFLLAFLPLLSAFLITFHILFPTKREYVPAWGLGFSKILAMMTGEVEYSDVFYGDGADQIAFRNVSKLLVLVFIISVVLLLHNLLIGMAVSDVQKLEEKAKVNHLARRLEDIYLMENIVTHPWVVKLVVQFKMDHWFKKAFIVEKKDTQKMRGGKLKRNKRLDEYPFEQREAVIQWDKEQKTKTELKSNLS